MKSFASKLPSKRGSSAKRSTAFPPVHTLPPASNTHNVGNSFIPQSDFCPCDGYCPRCAPVLQTKLRIGKPGDRYEQEADRVAEQIMRMPDSRVQRQPIEEEEELMAKPLDGQITPLIQRQPIEEEEEELQAKPIDSRLTPLIQRQPIEEEEEELQAKGMSEGAAVVSSSFDEDIQSLQGGGEPLSTPLQVYYEQRFGVDFGGVRIHHDHTAEDAAGNLNARAFTIGRDIAFGSGEYAPDTTEARKLIAHELTHVVQQTSAGNSGTALTRTNPEDRSESEAKASERAILDNRLIPEPHQRIGPATIAGDWSDPTGPEWRAYSRLRRQLERSGYTFRIREGSPMMPLGWHVTSPSGGSLDLDRSSILQWLRTEASRSEAETSSRSSDCPWDPAFVERQRQSDLDHYTRMQERISSDVARGHQVSVAHIRAPMGLPTLLRTEDQVTAFFHGMRSFANTLYDWAQSEILLNWRQHRTTEYFRTQPRGSWSIREYYNWLQSLNRQYITGAAGALATEGTRRVFQGIRARYGDLPPPRVVPTHAP